MGSGREPVTLRELLSMPASLDLPDACRALRISVGQGYKLLAAGAFPVPPLRFAASPNAHGRGVALRFALVDVLAVLGFDLDGVLRELRMDPASIPSPAREEAA